MQYISLDAFSEQQRIVPADLFCLSRGVDDGYPKTFLPFFFLLPRVLKGGMQPRWHGVLGSWSGFSHADTPGSPRYLPIARAFIRICKYLYLHEPSTLGISRMLVFVALKDMPTDGTQFDPISSRIWRNSDMGSKLSST